MKERIASLCWRKPRRRWSDVILVGGREQSVLQASRVRELRHGGAAGHTTWMPVVGWADETSGGTVFCSLSVVRSSRHQPATTERPGGDDLSLWGERENL